MSSLKRLCPHLALALFVLVFILGIAPRLATSPSDVTTEHYRIAKGQERTVHFSDGSWAHLRGGTEIEVVTRREQIVTELLSGRALFNVRHDPHRNFLVTLGKATIKDIGTQFEAFREWGQAGVSVIEGEVLLSGSAANTRWAKVAAGDKALILSDGYLFGELEISPDGTAATPTPRWFNGTLSHAANQFNSESRHLRFVVEGSARELRFWGPLADDEEFAEVLRRDPRIDVTQEGNILLVRPRSE